MTDFTVSGGRVTPYPETHYGGHFVGNRASFCLLEDFASGFDANVLAIPDKKVSVISASPVTVDDYFAGMHVQFRENDRMPEITARSVRSHDIASGDTRWDEIYVTEGNPDWTASDEWVNLHHIAAREMVYVLFGTPTWASARPTETSVYSNAEGTTNLGLAAEPADLTKWDAFCTTVATRYLGKVKYYEIWNEANDSAFFSGTKTMLAQMVRRANQAIKAVDPTAKIISPSITGWGPNAGALPETFFKEMLAAGDGVTGTMADWVDIIGVHLYLYQSRIYELNGVIDRINTAKTAAGVSAKPTWDTESAPGTPYIAGRTNEEAIQFIKRSMLIQAGKGIGRTFYYQWDHPTMGIKDRLAIVEARETTCDLLKSGDIESMYVFTNGQVAYHANGKTVFV